MWIGPELGLTVISNVDSEPSRHAVLSAASQCEVSSVVLISSSRNRCIRRPSQGSYEGP